MIKILIDENLPLKLKFRFGNGFEVLTINDMGWNAKKNGELLKLINIEAFHFLITSDKNIEYQQNLELINFKLVIINSSDNRYETVLPLIDKIKERIIDPASEKIIHVS